MRTTIAMCVILLSGCWSEVKYEGECNSPWGTAVFFRTPANPELTCEGFIEHEKRVIQSFVKHELPVFRLLERLPYTRVIVLPDGEEAGPGIAGYVRVEEALIVTKSSWGWEGTAVAHEYAHLAEDGWAKRGDWDTQWTIPYDGHEGWCANRVWVAVAESRDQPWGGSSCRPGQPTQEDLMRD